VPVRSPAATGARSASGEPPKVESTSDGSGASPWTIVVPVLVAAVAIVILYVFWRRRGFEARYQSELLSEIELGDEVHVPIFTNGDMPLVPEAVAPVQGSPPRAQMFAMSSDDELL
jgi:hypothetical protein